MKDSIQEAIRASSIIEDPLLLPGLINIHMIPPIQTHRYTRISFPYEIKICVAESWYTSRLYGSRDDQSAKMTRVLEQFRTLKATDQKDKFEAHPNQGSSVQNTLIVEPPEFFEERAEIGDFVSKEIRQWLSSMSSPGLSGQLSSVESFVDIDPYCSPRKSFSDVLKSSSTILDIQADSYRRSFLIVSLANFN